MNLSYRPEIDGLRALAVLSVILYHAEIVIFGHDFFSGGFVGVDIFFVISGYLISRILVSELFKQGRIDFFGFYERRARRILPVLFIVFLFSFPFAYKLLLPGQFIEYSQSILSAIFFGSNIFFYLTNTQYGAEDSLLQPFLHTWSLGVEEQFYILFPILLLLVYKFAQRYLIFIVLILILISLQYANWQSSKSIQFNFYMLASRFWELGFGSLLAFYELKYGKVKHEFLNSIMPLLGFLLIIYSIVFFNSQIPHPSFITLIPTLGTALIIIFSVNQSDLISKLLNLKPVVGIGLISYSMYLWHYPVFAFARSASINALDSIEKALLITLTIILSMISYKFIEKPFRKRQFLSLKKFILTILGMVFSIFILNINIKNELYEDFKLTTFDLKVNRKNCYKRDDNFCYVGTNNNGVIYLVGDSMMASLQNDLAERLKKDYLLISLTYGGRVFLNNGQTIIGNNAVDKNISKYNKKRLNEIKKFQNSTVIIFNSLPLHLENYRFQINKDVFYDDPYTYIKPDNGYSVEQTIIGPINELLENGNKVIIIYPFPESGFNVKKIQKRLIKMQKKEAIKWIDKNSERYSYSFEKYLARTKSSFELYDSIQHKNLKRVYSHKVVCDDDVKNFCYTFNNSQISYSDPTHPNILSVKKINNLIIEKLLEN
jgi:peptidoglycan/LPS O-acetylase OafA/YrhL